MWMEGNGLDFSGKEKQSVEGSVSVGGVRSLWSSGGLLHHCPKIIYIYISNIIPCLYFLGHKKCQAAFKLKNVST